MKSSKSTQQFVPIKEIRDGVVVLNDGSLRMILMASSLNFALKAEDEQNAIILQYQNFLNSLDFTVQFFIQSREINIGPYIESLREAEKEQLNELLKIQTREYINFVRNFVESTNIVAKTFYIIIPYSGSGFATPASIFSGLSAGWQAIFGGKSTDDKKSADDRFLEHKLQIQQRSAIVRNGLSSAGVRTVPLNTEELIEMYFKLFNPGETEKPVAGQKVISPASNRVK